jgi:hypothetical protein
MTTVLEYREGDLVLVKEDRSRILPSPAMRAIVVETSPHQRASYALYREGLGLSAWHDGCNLTLIRRGAFALLEEWKREAEARRILHSNPEWIFTHGRDVIDKWIGASLQVLADDLGMGDLWGSRGEGFVLAANCQKVIHLATPFLLDGDREGWLIFCQKERER